MAELFEDLESDWPVSQARNIYRRIGDHKKYLKYYYAQKTDRLTLSSYREFKKECRNEEWAAYEPKLVDILEKDFDIEVFSAAKELEVRYPIEILTFYKSSIGNLNVSEFRKFYSNNAAGVARVQRMLVDVMRKPEEWKKYAVTIKLNNIKRPAFQDEFSRVIPGWDNL